MINNKEIIEIFEESAKIKVEFIRKNVDNVIKVINRIISAIDNGNKILICGNGGSAADAQHIAAELVVRFSKNRKALPAIALTTDTSVITATGNDFDFTKIFSRQIEALGKKGDILLAISTSGNSENVINAVKKAKELGILTIGLLGKDGGKLKQLVDIPLIVNSTNTARIQECHQTIYHTICEYVERWYTNDN